MSIKIRKYEGGEVFDLPSNYVIESEKNNPLFQKKGSQTVPVNFPTTVKNNRLLNFPFRLDRASKQEGTIDVIVETGSVQQKGLLSVNSAGSKIISGNIGYDESEMYSVFENLKLNEIPDLPEVPVSGNNVDQKIDSILAHLTGVMREQVVADYTIFPVVLVRVKEKQEFGPINIWEIVNEINAGVSYPTNVAIGDLLALENRTIFRYEENELIQIFVPKGYGICPFLKVWRVLELIFSHFKFTVDENPFQTHRQLNKLVLLNNTIDSIVTGRLLYKDMLPDITIKEFLDGLFNKFGMVYFVDSNSRKVSFKFIKDLINPESRFINLTNNKTEELSISFSSPSQLRLKMRRESERAQVLFDTFEEFLKRFKFQFNGGTKATQIFDPEYSRYTIINIFRIFSDNPEEAFTHSSDFFDWDKKTASIAYEDIDMKDLCLPISDYDLMRIPEYLTGFKHAYSDLVVGGEVQQENVNPAKLAFIFSWGLVQSDSNANLIYPFASQFNRDHNGDFMTDGNGVKYDISLTCNREDGLYNRFWKEYDAFLRHSNQEVTGKFHLPEIELSNLKLFNPVFIDNQPYIIDQAKYKLNQKDAISEFTLKTLRLFTPYNLDELWHIPEYTDQVYYWEYTIEVIPPSFPPPNYIRTVKTEFIHQKFITINGIQTPISYLSFLPPTEDQYIANEQRIYQYSRIDRIVYLTNLHEEAEYDFRREYTITFYPERVS